MTVTPVNYRKQDASPEAIARDVDYALQIADFYLGKLPASRRRLENVRVLELGPGYSLGTAVVIACYGARVSVADRYLSSFDPDYHGPFLEALRARLAADRPQVDLRPIDRVLEAQEFVSEVVDGLHLGIEDLEELPDGCFDVVLSNAVFEHVENVHRAWAILARITRSGGMGIHQVDFRDHRDFSRPLEYLTLVEDDFRALFREVHGECGNRWRPDAMEQVIAEAGFEVASFEANMQADAAYLDDLIPRLAPEFSNMSRQSLEAISGCFVLRRSSVADASSIQQVDSLQSLAHGRCRYGFAATAVAGKRVLDLGCGVGLGTRELLAAGAADVVAIDSRPEALDLARENDPRGEAAWAVYLQHDLEQALPFEDGSFDVVVALDVLECVEDRRGLCRQIARVLSPDGVAYVSVPNRMFEEYWAELTDGLSAPPDSVPTLEEFVELLEPFPWVDFHGQVDVVASVVLPLDAEESEPAVGELRLPSGISLGDPGTLAVIARCFATRPVNLPRQTPVAHAFGDDGEQRDDDVARDRLVFERLRALAARHLGPADPSG